MKIIELREDIGVKNIGAFYEELKDVLHQEKEVVLDFSAVKRVDLSVIQVIMSGQRYARNGKKEMKLKNVSPDVKNQLRLSCLLK